MGKKIPTSFEFAELGDQWLITYLFSASIVPVPTLFTIGHSIEAYCKAALLRHDPSLNIYQKKYGHNIEAMLLEIKQSIGIMMSVEFRPNIVERFMTGGPIPLTEGLMSDPDNLHYVANQELYWVSKFQQDLKYIGTSGERMPAQFSIFVMGRNPFWVPILRELRGFILAGENNETMSMRGLIGRADLPNEVKTLIEQIIGRAI